MYKVFLVDDEIVIREGIRNGFPWDEGGFTLCGEAPDGEMAFPMIADLKPDILITDIRMPFMDGLELSRRVASALPWTSIIILSGYDDFHYAQEAIAIGVRQYLLKPVTPRKLAEALRQTAERISQERARLADAAWPQPSLSAEELQTRELQVSSLLSKPSDETMTEAAASLGLPPSSAQYLVILLGGLREELMPRLKASLLRLTQAQPQTYCTTLLDHPALLLAQPAGEGGADSLEERAYALASALEYEAGRAGLGRPAIAIGSPVSRVQDLPQALASARAVFRAASGQPPRIVGSLDVDLSASLEQMEAGSLPLSERLRYAALKDGDEITEQYFLSMGDLAAQSVLVLNFLLMDVLLAASRIIRQCGGEPSSVLPARLMQQAELLKLSRHPGEALRAAQELVREALRFRDSNLASRYGETLRSACAYIDQNFHRPELSLQDVAGHVALSGNHFSTVFSQEMGLTFTEYLTKTRLDRAKQLLGSTQNRSVEIAAAIGYSDPHYFSYLFKKQVGMAPREFRRSLQSDS